MTKYILNSGGLRNKPEKATLFFKEMVKGQSESPKILLCFFAEKREKWEEKFENYKQRFVELVGGGVRPIFELALPDKFIKQTKSSEVIVIYGGDDYLLRSYLEKYDLPEIFKDKVVAGSSAGSDVLVKHFWTCDWRRCLDGLGILPIKFIPHFKSEYGNDDPRGPIVWAKAHQELSEYGDKNLPIYALEEGDFIVFEK